MKTVIPGLSSRDWGDDGCPELFTVNGREYVDPCGIFPVYLSKFGAMVDRQPLLLTRKWPAGPADPQLVPFCWRAQRCDTVPSHRVEVVFGHGSAGPGSVRR